MTTSKVEFYLRDAGNENPILVQPCPQGFYLPNQGGVIVPSARQLLLTYAWHGIDRHWSLARWQGTSSQPPGLTNPGPTIFDALAELAATSSRFPPTRSQTQYRRPRKSDPNDSNHLEKTTDSVDSISGLVLPSCGIDLAKRGHEVAKLLYAGFGSRMYASGYDPEEVLQEVYKGILTRNRGRGAFDARKSSFGHYVHMVCSCILSNYHRKVSRTRYKEVAWPQTMEGEDQVFSDPRQHTEGPYGCSDQLVQEDFRTYLTIGNQGDLKTLALEVLPLVQEGLARAEISKRLEVNRVTISKALSYLRSSASSF